MDQRKGFKLVLAIMFAGLFLPSSVFAWGGLGDLWGGITGGGSNQEQTASSSRDVVAPNGSWQTVSVNNHTTTISIDPLGPDAEASESVYLDPQSTSMQKATGAYEVAMFFAIDKDYAKTVKWCDNAINVLVPNGQVDMNLMNTEAVALLSKTYSVKSDSYMKQEQYALAEQVNQGACKVFEKIAQDSGLQYDAKIALASAQLNLGNALSPQGKTSEAKQAYSAAWDVFSSSSDWNNLTDAQFTSYREIQTNAGDALNALK